MTSFDAKAPAGADRRAFGPVVAAAAAGATALVVGISPAYADTTAPASTPTASDVTTAPAPAATDVTSAPAPAPATSDASAVVSEVASSVASAAPAVQSAAIQNVLSGNLASLLQSGVPGSLGTGLPSVPTSPAGCANALTSLAQVLGGAGTVAGVPVGNAAAGANMLSSYCNLALSFPVGAPVAAPASSPSSATNPAAPVSTTPEAPAAPATTTDAPAAPATQETGALSNTGPGEISRLMALAALALAAGAGAVVSARRRGGLAMTGMSMAGKHAKLGKTSRPVTPRGKAPVRPAVTMSARGTTRPVSARPMPAPRPTIAARTTGVARTTAPGRRRAVKRPSLAARTSR